MAGLRDLSPAEFESFLQQNAGNEAAAISATEPFPAEPQELPAFEAPDFTAPATQAALDQSSSNLNLFTAPTVQQGARPGVALDRETGLPFLRQLALELHRRPVDKFRSLQRQYGDANVNLAPDGNFVVRNQLDPDTGRPKDFVVERGGINKATFIAALPEIVFGTIGARLGHAGAGRLVSSKLLQTVGSLIGMAGLGQTAGAAKDAAVRLFGGDPLEVGEIAKERAKDAGIDFAFGAALGSTVKLTSRGISPFSNAGAAQAEERAAVAALEQTAGETMPRTLGEMSGNKLLLRAEAQFSKQPGSSAAFEAVQEAKDGFIRRLQNRFLGLPTSTQPSGVAAALPGQEATGQKALGVLGSQALQLEGNVAKAAQAVSNVGTAEAQKIAGVSIPSRIDTTVLGAVQRRSVTRSFEAFKAKAAADYNTFLSKPEITERIVPIDDLAKEAASARAKLPSAKVTKEVPDVDSYGGATLTTKTVIERLDEFVAPKVRATLDRLSNLKGATTSINDLKQIRTSLDDAIAEGVSIPGTDVKQLFSIRDMVNKATRQGLEGLPNGQNLLKEWDVLNASYRQGISRFDRTAIRQILVKPGESGAVMNTALVERTFGNSPGAKDVYDEYRKFWGPQSVEFRSLQLAIAEDALGAGALKPGTSTIDGKRLLANLNGMRREVAEEILGVKQDELRRIGEALGAAQGKLDVSELAALAKSKTLTAEKLTELISAEGTRATAYKNRLVAAAAKGAIDTEKIQPAEFVRYMTKASEPEVRDVLARFQDQPELLQAIRSLAGEEFLASAGVGVKLSPSAIQKTFGDRARQDVWRAMLGDDTYKTLQQFETALRPTEMATKQYQGMGQISASMQIMNVFGRGELPAVPGILTRTVISFIYTGPGRLLANNLITPGEAHRFVNGVIASEPFLSYLTDRFGMREAESAVDALGDAVSTAYKRNMQLRGQVPLEAGQRLNLRNMSKEEFDAYLKQNR